MYLTQNGPLSRGSWGPFFISRVPKGASPAQRFPIETLFGVRPIPATEYRLELAGAFKRPGTFTLDDLAPLPVHARMIRISCVSGWTSVNTWSGYLVRDVLALAGLQPGVKQLSFRSVTDYSVPWPAHRLLGDNALLATKVNGEDLMVEHGGPVRLIAPGYPGQDMVKQVVRIRAGTDPNRFDPDLMLTEAAPRPGSPCAVRSDAGEGA
jgi:DMSO/TMAO reductase YedYZ molybdopterin-dependent catalytic subunit